MTTSRLPEIVLTCRNGHPFGTKARGNTTVRCKTCGAPKRVPADRPRSARELAATTTAAAPEPGRELAARWDREPEWDGGLTLRPGRAGDTCPGCGEPVAWEPGRTLVYCAACKAEGHPPVQLPAAVEAHYERQEQRSAEVAVRAGPDESALRAARVRLRAQQETLTRHVGDWLDGVADPDSYDRAQWQRQAAELGAALRGYLPEISAAKDETTLTAVYREVEALLTGEQGRALTAEYGQAQERAERWAEARARQAEQQEREAEAQRAAEAEERQRQRAEAERARLAAQQRKAITSGTAARNPDPYGMEQIALMFERARQEKERRLAEYGPCGYQEEHRKPEAPKRRYWIMSLDWQGNETDYAVPEAPQTVVCKKHFGKADAWIEAQAAALRRVNPQSKAVYTELT